MESIHICRDLIVAGEFWGFIPEHLFDPVSMRILNIEDHYNSEHEVFARYRIHEEDRESMEILLGNLSRLGKK